MLDFVVTSFVTLFVVVDPPGLAPIFLALTRGMERAERIQVARQASLIAFGVLAGATLIGEWLLRTLGIGLPAFRIAGGLLLFAIAFEMVFEKREERKARSASESQVHATAGIAAFPLAIPLMAGPGAITASILLSGKAASLGSLVTLLAIIAAVLALCFIVFRGAHRIERVVGPIGQAVFARLLGVLLVALAVQFVIDGVAELGF